MMRHWTLLVLCFGLVSLVTPVQQQVRLSDSYLPVAMQIIAHLTDQMSYEVKDEPVTSKPTTKPLKPVTTASYKPVTNAPYKPVTNAPYKPVTTAPYKPSTRPPYMPTKPTIDTSTPFHKPGLFAPSAPPKPFDRVHKDTFILLPLDENTQHTVIQPPEKRTQEPLLSVQSDEVKPLVEPVPEKGQLLLPHFGDKARSEEQFDEDNLQYLSDNVKDLIKMANDPDDERLVDVFEGARAGPAETGKAKMSSSNLRLMLLYDLLSREAKRKRLSDYSGFAPSVLKTLSESSSGGARAQLRLALSTMLSRGDCEHEYANNRAREMVAELDKDESKLSAEIRYLQPLVYRL